MTHLRPVPPAHPAAPPAQKSCDNRLPQPVSGGRGRSAGAMRRAHGRRHRAEMHQFRADFPDLWRDFLQSQFRSREAVSDYFEVAFQTACNWWEAKVRPSGDKVAQAAIEFRADFLRAMGETE